MIFSSKFCRVFHYLILLSAITVGSASALAQSIAGTWEINADGFKGLLLLEQEGTVLNGYYRLAGASTGEYAVQGSVQNGEVYFTRAGERREAEQRFHGFLFSRDGSTMAGTFSSRGERDGGWVARQTSAKPIEPRRPRPDHAGGHHAPRTIVGSWDWVAGQIIKIRDDGVLFVYERDRQINSGKWEKLSDGSFRFTYQSGGFVDTVRLSDDGQNLFGENNRGRSLQATRAERYSGSIVGTWSWPLGQRLVVYPNGKLSIFEGNRQTNTGRWENLPDDSIRFTHAIGGFVDTVRLSPDGNRIEGRNKDGKRVEGTRLE